MARSNTDTNSNGAEKATRVRRAQDPEVKAMADILAILGALDVSARVRVMRFVTERTGTREGE